MRFLCSCDARTALEELKDVLLPSVWILPASLPPKISLEKRHVFILPLPPPPRRIVHSFLPFLLPKWGIVQSSSSPTLPFSYSHLNSLPIVSFWQAGGLFVRSEHTNIQTVSHPRQKHSECLWANVHLPTRSSFWVGLSPLSLFCLTYLSFFAQMYWSWERCRNSSQEVQRTFFCLKHIHLVNPTPISLLLCFLWVSFFSLVSFSFFSNMEFKKYNTVAFLLDCKTTEH